MVREVSNFFNALILSIMFKLNCCIYRKSLYFFTNALHMEFIRPRKN